VYTDHKPLTYAISRVSDPWNARQCRQLAYVAEYTSDIRHIAGAENIVADTLSRPPGHVPRAMSSPSFPAGGLSAGNGQRATSTPSRPSPQSPASSPVRAAGQLPTRCVLSALVPATSLAAVDFVAMAGRQLSCPSTQQAKASSALLVQPINVQGTRLLCDMSRGLTRPLVPEQDRPVVFRAIHDVAHPGIRVTRRLIAARFVWHGLAKDVNNWCRDCQACQRGKVTKQPAAPSQFFPTPVYRFEHVHVDLVGPLPSSEEGHVYLMTIIDRSTRWAEAIPLRNMGASTCAENFVSGWIARFGTPATVTSDRGTQFTSPTWAGLCKRLGIEHILTTAFHPQANGMVERVHRQIKDALRAREAGAAWHSHLPWVLLGLRAAPKEESGISSAEQVLGTPLVLPGELLTVPEPSVSCGEQAPVKKKSYAEAAASPPAHFAQAQYVYVRRGGCGPPLAPAYLGPFEVLQRHAKTFTLQMGSRAEVVSVDRLKAHTGPSPISPASPPVRGRPPASSRVQPTS
jgi:transposase InsO family protein